MTNELHPMLQNTMLVEEAARYLGIGMQSLHSWRSMNIGPAYFKIGGRIRYRKIDLDAWVERKMTSTFESEPVNYQANTVTKPGQEPTQDDSAPEQPSKLMTKADYMKEVA